MYVTQDELKKINGVQIEILREVVSVCNKLNIKFYMVHGRLLGTIRHRGFVPFDNDIDIAMRRCDYEYFLKEAPKIISKNYFIQSIYSEENYPLPFAKVRDIRTTYICESVKNINMNHGVYIDIFPIDNSSAKISKINRLKEKLLNSRISSSSLYLPKRTFKQKLKNSIAYIFCQSVKHAIRKREYFYKAFPESDYIRITGGKPSERAIQKEWFDEAEESLFEGIHVYIPKEYDKYLRCIYGDYEKRTLVEGKMAGNKVKLNACVVDLEKSYTYYMPVEK
jgi:lipopolysaccharide cholinephosphotransferase